MKVCTGIWITAAIQRAVDDKTAKNLLGESFKSQLKYDGSYSAVTFICTKTDDILESEVSNSLDIEGKVAESWGRIETLRRTLRTLQVRIRDLKGQKNDFDDQLEDLEKRSDNWEDLLGKLVEGETVYRPLESKKRKRKTGLNRRRKRQDSGNHLSDSDHLEDSENVRHKEDSQAPLQKIPLTEEEIEEQLANFKAQKKELRKSKRNIQDEISTLREDAARVSGEEGTLLSEVKLLCIQGRNEYSRASIKKDFAMGIKE